MVDHLRTRLRHANAPTAAKFDATATRQMRSGWRHATAALAAGVFLAGCATSPTDGASNSAGLIDAALGAVGLQRAQEAPRDLPADGLTARAPKPVKLTLRLHAGQLLNTDSSGQSLTLITRVYKLRNGDAFLQAPYDTFKESTTEKAALGDALVDAREVLLKPGSKHETVHTLAPDTPYLGVVALFRSPAEQRWRFMFDVQASAKNGVTLGAHGCALSVAEGAVVGAPPETLRLAGVQCD